LVKRKDKAQEMFRRIKTLQAPSVGLFKAELPQDFSGELRQRLRSRGIAMAQIPTTFNPSTYLTPYTKLFLKISNRNLS
jgi:hypothetical protein